MQDDIYENELGFIFRGLVRSCFIGSRSSCPSGTRAHTSSLVNAPEYGRSYFYKEEGGVGVRRVGEWGEYKPFIQGKRKCWACRGGNGLGEGSWGSS